ncbi:hypothetical protein [Nonomuraea jabiensis]|uniref:Trypsin n=1 Tax=Nonomuraea jabiensis TaxID=882448 RepID=A0A7W9GC34_9ACTN|nr:hypothetical protein [Nonomuraea jabiensis]MBB5781035.1 hypothetical protein [Nonomuraea jabiensis]
MKRLFAIILAGTLTFGFGSAASADDEKPGVQKESTPFSYISPGDRDKLIAQIPLQQAASRIRWAVERTKAPGFAGIALQDGQVVLWWKGSPPAAVQTAIASARQEAPIQTRRAPHSLAELEAASAAVVARMRANPASPFHTVVIPVDGSGLVVQTESNQADKASILQDIAVPVRVVQHERITPAGRLDDTAPFYGGMRINNNDNNSFCTAGFGVVAGGAEYLLTAGHCGRTNGGFNNGNDSRFVGTATQEQVSHDLLLISTDAGSRIWDGGVPGGLNTGGEFTKGVVGWDWAYSGEYVCHSGSRSGAVCSIQNSGNFTATTCGNDVYGNYECYTDLIYSERTNGSPACQGGDSGGPVFTLSGSSDVIAKGTITGCGGNAMTYQDFGTAWRDFGVTPIT